MTRESPFSVTNFPSGILLASAGFANCTVMVSHGLLRQLDVGKGTFSIAPHRVLRCVQAPGSKKMERPMSTLKLSKAPDPTQTNPGIWIVVDEVTRPLIMPLPMPHFLISYG